jgi:oligosaccharide reducing-end xylanase
VAQYYFAARGCSGQVVPATPSDFLNISSFILGNTGSYTTGTNINALADDAYRSGGWCVYLTHAIDGDSGYSPLSSSALQASVNYTSGNPAKFWVETFGDVVRYIKERNASSVSETANTGSSITVLVTNMLGSTIYNYPITLRRPFPTNWPAMSVTQNGQAITPQLVTISSTNYAMFDVVPNAGNVVLTETVLPFTLSNPALPAPGSLTFKLTGQSNVTYTISSSADLVNWTSNQTCTLKGISTNITVNASSNGVQFYRAQWSP